MGSTKWRLCTRLRQPPPPPSTPDLRWLRPAITQAIRLPVNHAEVVPSGVSGAGVGGENSFKSPTLGVSQSPPPPPSNHDKSSVTSRPPGCPPSIFVTSLKPVKVSQSGFTACRGAQMQAPQQSAMKAPTPPFSGPPFVSRSESRPRKPHERRGGRGTVGPFGGESAPSSSSRPRLSAPGTMVPEVKTLTFSDQRPIRDVHQGPFLPNDRSGAPGSRCQAASPQAPAVESRISYFVASPPPFP